MKKISEKTITQKHLLKMKSMLSIYPKNKYYQQQIFKTENKLKKLC
jgi:hypothetical protein